MLVEIEAEAVLGAKGMAKTIEAKARPPAKTAKRRGGNKG
jgi:hypothetical protein